jgi:2-polyprenyl-6-methoxyphenol hydroxylase-like FAD-dependent oxidoreductase
MAPVSGERPDELRTWEEVKLLTVQVDRLERWYRPGLLCLGDAAHAMSPIGGVGINLAIQDAVAATNILAAPLRAGPVSESYLKEVQNRRELPTWATQSIQLAIQRGVITRVLDDTKPFKAPLALRMIAKIPLLQRIPARLIGLGIRPEHVKVAAAPRS